MSQSTHKAVAFPSQGARLQEIQLDTPAVQPGKVLVRVNYVSPTPLDVWQGVHGLVVDKWPLIPSDSLTGIVVEAGENVDHVKPGDKVVSFTFGPIEGRGAQQVVLLPGNRVGKIPDNVDPVATTSVPANLVTAVHSITHDLKLPLILEPSDKPIDETLLNKKILVWGGSTSVGQYAIQLLKLSGYHNIITTASARHHEHLKQLGATKIVDYTAATWKNDLGNDIDFGLDCVGDAEESLRKIGEVTRKEASSRIAALLPIRHGGRQVTNISFQPEEGLLPKEITYIGVRTHFYEENEYFKQHLQPRILPSLLASGKIKPNNVKIIDEGTTVASYQKAIDLLSAGEVSGEKIVIKVL